MRRILSMMLLIAVVIPLVGENLPLEGKNVIFVIAPEFFRDEELIIPTSKLNSLGATTQLASTTTEEVEGMMGMLAKPDMLIEDIAIEDFDAIVIVGGIGAEKLWDNEILHNKLKAFNKEKKLIGAICLGPVVLSRAGLLEEQQATCFPSTKDELTKGKAVYVEKPVIATRNIVTANGPDAAEAFAKTLSQILAGPPKTEVHD